MQVALPELLWYGSRRFEIDLPDAWEVTIHPMRGAGAPALTREQMAEAVNSPIGRPRLRELAKGRKKAVIMTLGRSGRSRGTGPPACLKVLSTPCWMRFLTSL